MREKERVKEKRQNAENTASHFFERVSCAVYFPLFYKKIGHVQKTLYSWWKRKVAYLVGLIDDYVKHIFRFTRHEPISRISERICEQRCRVFISLFLSQKVGRRVVHHLSKEGWLRLEEVVTVVCFFLSHEPPTQSP